MQAGSDDSSQHGQGDKQRLRVYQQWQGNEKFFCWGFLVAGPNWKASIGTALLIAAPAGVFLGLVAPYMAEEVNVALLVIGCILPTLAVIFLMMTACRDPGVIPRQEPDQEYMTGQKPRTKDVYVNNQRVVIRYNDTCHFYQPPRAHHCSVNDNCIERFDHHCPWVGTTIGQRNYRTFLLFVYTSAFLCMYVFGVCLAMLFVKHDQLTEDAKAEGRQGDTWGKALGQCVPALVLMGYTFLFFWFVGGLSVFHAYLVGTNQTTYENFRYNHDNRPNPYSRGCLRNCAEVWCLPVPPSKVPFRAYVDDFRAPTGQPYSPYLAGQDAAAGGAEANGNGHDHGAAHDVETYQPPPPPPMPPAAAVQMGGLGGGGGMGQGAAAGGAMGMGTGAGVGGGYANPADVHVAMPRDPAALRPGPIGGTLGPHGAGLAAVESRYSDAGAGWAAGGGPHNEPPAQMAAGGYQSTFSAGPGARGPGAAGAFARSSAGVYNAHGGHGGEQEYGEEGAYDDEDVDDRGSESSDGDTASVRPGVIC